MSQFYLEEVTGADAQHIDQVLPNSNKWDKEWLSREIRGVKVREFARKLEQPGVAYCVWCETDLIYGGTGFNAFVLHCATEKHRMAQELYNTDSVVDGKRRKLSRAPKAVEMLKRPRNVSWLYFERRDGDTNHAWCKVCGLQIKCDETSTGPLYMHLKTAHPWQYVEAETKRREEMDEYLKRQAKIYDSSEPLIRSSVGQIGPDTHKNDLRKKNSRVWRHFTRKGDTQAICRYCGDLKYSTGWTTSLIRHMNAFHKTEWEEDSNIEADEPEEFSRKDYRSTVGSVITNPSVSTPKTPTAPKVNRLRKPSRVWLHFFKNPDNPSIVVCTHCRFEFNYSSSTSNMINHMNTRHWNEWAESAGAEQDVPEENPKKKSVKTTQSTKVRKSGATTSTPLRQSREHQSFLGWGSTANTIKHMAVWEESDVIPSDEPVEKKKRKRRGRKRKKRSIVWKHFSKRDGEPDKAFCNHCGREMANAQGSTSSLMTHVKRQHEEELKKALSEPPDESDEPESSEEDDDNSDEGDNIGKEEDTQQAISGTRTVSSLIWRHFHDDGGPYLTCKHCKKKITRTKSSATIHLHLKYKHRKKYEAMKAKQNELLEGSRDGKQTDGTSDMGLFIATDGQNHAADNIDDFEDVQQEQEEEEGMASEELPGGSVVSTNEGSPGELGFKAARNAKIWQHFIRLTPTVAQCITCRRRFRAHTGSMVCHLRTIHPERYAQFTKSRPYPFLRQIPGKAISQVKIANKPFSHLSRFSGKGLKAHADQALLAMFVWDLEQPSIIKKPGFRKFVSVLNPRYELPKKAYVTGTLYPQVMEETKQLVKTTLSRSSHFALTVESWTYKDTQPFLTVSAHAINQSWQRTTHVLDTFDSSIDKTVTGLATNLKRITDAWNISDKVVAVLSSQRDENLSSACVVNGWDDLLCFGNTLNTIVTEALASVTEIVRLQKKVSEAVAFFNLNVKASETLLAVQQEHNRPEHRLKQLRQLQQQQQQEEHEMESKEAVGSSGDGQLTQSQTASPSTQQTSWLSIFAMFQRMIEQYEAVNTVLCYLSADDLCICDDDMDIIKRLIQILEPFQLATEELCAQPFTSLSKVIPIATLLQHVSESSLSTEAPAATNTTNITPAQTESQSNTAGENVEGTVVQDRGPVLADQVQADLKNALASQIQQHLSTVENNHKMAVATLLDPRFKQHAFLDFAALVSAKQRLLVDLQAMQGATAGDGGEGQKKKSTETGDKLASFWGMFQRRVEEAGASCSESTEIENEMNRFLKEAIIPRTKDPLQWWNINAVQYPHLKVLAQKYLCVPATALDSSRIFTKQASEFARRRDCLHPDKIHSMLFLNKNLTHI